MRDLIQNRAAAARANRDRPVPELPELTRSRAPSITGVVFEVLDEFLKRPRPDGIAHELEWARTIRRRHHPTREVAE
jgi:hypothetical protein